ncbi:MAG TPA: alpha/beta hydrolase [Gemmatimonadales bacterium]|nr:alpha/beta hydrolase [Gemmatimonadales bacterium]
MDATPRRLPLVIAAVTSGLVATAGCHARPSSNESVRAPEGLAVTVRGLGTDVVLIHGALGDYRQWEPIGGVLSSSYRVIAVSRRFHWPNPPPMAHSLYSFEEQSEDLNGLLDSLDRPVHLVGHSYGAGVALLTALRHPDLVRSLTLIEPPFGSLVPPSAPGFAAELASRDSMVAALRVQVQAGSVEHAAEGLIDWVEGEPGGFHQLPQATQDELLTNAATAGPTYAVPSPRVTCDQLHKLRLPVLVLRGEQTRPWYRLIAEATANCIRGAETAVIPAARHMTIVENPSGTASLVLGFIGRH